MSGYLNYSGRGVTVVVVRVHKQPLMHECFKNFDCALVQVVVVGCLKTTKYLFTTCMYTYMYVHVHACMIIMSKFTVPG